MAEMQQAIDKKTATRTAAKYLEKTDLIFEDIFANMRLLNMAVRKRIIEMDEKGRPILDGNGQPKFNPKLDPNSIKALSATLTEYYKMVRLEEGKSTENTSSRFSGEVTTISKGAELFDAAIRKVLESGDVGGQEALTKMAESRQKVLESAGGQGDE